jgi:hypothetical protein
MNKLLSLGAAVAVSAGLGVGCAEPEPAREGVVLDEQGDNPLASGEAFVAIPRESSDAELSAQREALSGLGVQQQALLQTGQQSFYLAIRKSALDKKWFLSGFLKSLSLAESLEAMGNYNMGTDVVGFRQQNGKLFIVRDEAGTRWTDTVDPDVLIDAYPIVTGLTSFNRLGGAGDYVLVDPSRGLNNIVLTTSSGATSFQSRLDVDLAYLQNFTQLDDGVSFETVLAGSRAFDQGGGLPLNPTYALTSTLSLREYKEGPGYAPVAPPAVNHYFPAPVRVQRDHETVSSERVAKWDIHPGMQPIEWLITRNALALGEQYDVPLVDVIKQGVESWNAVFGFEALHARLANPGEEVGRDDRNFVIVDSDVALGYAYADWRTNPSTGEIRGANVYFPATWFASNFFSDDPPAQAAAAVAPAGRLAVRWNGLSENEPLCALAADAAGMREEASAGAGNQLSAGEKFGRFLQHAITHEVGHTLGLEHNFKGSLVPPSSSVMDYLNASIRAVTPVPQAYDIEAIKYLYGLSSELPSQPFCNNADQASDPDCVAFDRGADPLNQVWGPTYAQLISLAVQGGYAAYADYFDYYTTALLGYVRAGTPEQAAQAWSYLATLAAPLPPEYAAEPAIAALADEVMRTTLSRLYAEDETVRAGLQWGYPTPTNDPEDAAVVAQITDQLAQNLLNTDGVRSFETRRLAVDLLKHLQSVEAYQALLDARTTLNTTLSDGSLEGANVALTTDLIARIDAVTAPYFE